jgi:hypothetical protein
LATASAAAAVPSSGSAGESSSKIRTDRRSAKRAQADAVRATIEVWEAGLKTASAAGSAALILELLASLLIVQRRAQPTAGGSLNQEGVLGLHA